MLSGSNPTSRWHRQGTGPRRATWLAAKGTAARRSGRHPSATSLSGFDVRGDRQRRNGPGLQQPQPVARDRPLDVLWREASRLGFPRERGHAPRELWPNGLLWLRDDRRVLVGDEPFVSIDGAAHELVSETAGGTHAHLVTVAGERIGRERDASHLGLDHLLHQNRHRANAWP